MADGWRGPRVDGRSLFLQVGYGRCDSDGNNAPLIHWQAEKSMDRGRKVLENDPAANLDSRPEGVKAVLRPDPSSNAELPDCRRFTCWRQAGNEEGRRGGDCAVA